MRELWATVFLGANNIVGLREALSSKIFFGKEIYAFGEKIHFPR